MTRKRTPLIPASEPAIYISAHRQQKPLWGSEVVRQSERRFKLASEAWDKIPEMYRVWGLVRMLRSHSLRAKVYGQRSCVQASSRRNSGRKGVSRTSLSMQLLLMVFSYFHVGFESNLTPAVYVVCTSCPHHGIALMISSLFSLKFVSTSLGSLDSTGRPSVP